MTESYTQDQADQLVRIAYELILLRSPDPPGGAAAADNLTSGKSDIFALFQALLQSEEFAVHQTSFIHHYVKPEWRRLLLDHTQNGEFKFILEFLMSHGHTNKVIVDVGARGIDRSNSYDLMKHFGWRGLLIEANARLHPAIREAFAGTHFELENAAVSDYEGTAAFFFGVNDDVSSLSQIAAAGWGDIQGTTNVNVHRLATLLGKHDIPADFDILSLDIEGEDIRALNMLIDASAYRPRLIVIEIGGRPDIADPAALGFSSGVLHHYEYFAHCGPNLFLKRTV
jgi:FkbM family methyltransferase